jgi:hypothetical protein
MYQLPIYFMQTAAIDRILKVIEKAEYLFYTTDMESDLQFEGVQESSQIIDQEIYIQKIGKLLHLATNTRPDIT